MKKINLCVIFGGQSTEHDVSIVSGTSIIQNLNKEKYNIYPVYIDKTGDWYEYTKSIEKIKTLHIGELPENIKIIDNIIKYLKKMNIVFPVLHGKYGEDGTIQGLLDLLKISYVGCGVSSSSICMDKVYTKIIFEKMNLTQAKYAVINVDNNNNYIYVNDKLEHLIKNEDEICKIVKDRLSYPVFVKPSNSGSSVGVNKAKNDFELISNINIAKKYDKKILIEEAIIGKEIECAVLGKGENIEISRTGQIQSAEEFYSYNSKYKNKKSNVVIPAEINTLIENKIRNIARKAYKAIDCNGLARIDFFVQNVTNKIYINEINTMPGFTNISMYPKLWQHEGVNYTKLLDKIIELAK